MDAAAFEDAYQRYAALVYARCRRILRDPDAASDVTQEVFIRCLHHHDQLRSGRELLGWLYRVATNLCLNLVRDQKLRRSLDAQMASPTRGWSEPPTVQEVLQLLAGLDERAQTIAIYVHVDGMTHAEAAEVAQVSERTVRNALARFAEHGRRLARVVPGVQGQEGGDA